LKLSVDSKNKGCIIRIPSDNVATFFNNIKQSSVWALVQIEF